MRVKCVNKFANPGHDDVKEGLVYFVYITKIGFAGIKFQEGPKVFLKVKDNFIKGEVPRDGVLMLLTSFRQQVILGNLKILGDK